MLIINLYRRFSGGLLVMELGWEEASEREKKHYTGFHSAAVSISLVLFALVSAKEPEWLS